MRMIYSNRPLCTVFERQINAETRLEEYVSHTFSDVYWEEKQGHKANKNSTPSDSLLVLLQGESTDGYVPKPGDVIALGSPTDIPGERFTVREVFDCRYGRMTPHIEVRAV